MRSFGFLLCYLAGLPFVQAQHSAIDSLRQELTKTTVDDTARIDLLTDLAFYYTSVHPPQGIRYALEAEKLAKNLHQPARLATAYNYKALNYQHNGQDSLAILWFHRAIQQAQLLKRPVQEAGALHNLAILYTDVGDYERALTIRQQVTELLDGTHDYRRLSIAQNSTGAVHLQLANYPTALHHFQLAYQTAHAHGHSPTAWLALENMGLVYKKMGNYHKALDYYRQALAGYNEQQHTLAKSNLLANMASLYDEQHQRQKALALFKEALSIDEAAGYKRGIARHLTGIATVYSGLGEYQYAFLYFNKADSLLQQTPDANAMAALYTSWAEAVQACPDSSLQHVGYARDKRVAITKNFAQKGLAYARQSGLKEKEMYLSLLLSKIYQQQQQYERALQAYQQYIVLRDTLIGEDRKIAILKKELEFEADKKELQHQLLLQKQYSRQSIVIACALFILAMGIVAFIIYKKRRDYQQLQKELRLKATISDTEMKVLRLQMNPHFIFNCLNSISNYLLKHDFKQADYYLSKFAKLMRITLEHSQEKTVPLKEELETLELYIKLEQMRLNHNFGYQFLIHPTIDTENIFVPPLILQPFVENSIWHGFSSKTTLGFLSITIHEQAPYLLCTIEDNGIGRSAQRTQKKQSHGIHITQERLQLLGQVQDNRKAEIKINDLTPGTQVVLKLPLIL